VPRKSQSRARELPFATTTYQADHDGVLRAQLPSRCVFATGTQTCSIFVDHYRPRKSGPGHPVAVIGCLSHRFGRYTLYPPGHVPYGRRPVVAYRPTGELVVDPKTGGPLWERTLFAAALDAAEGELWPSEGQWFGQPDPRRRQTQARHLHRAGRLVGVHPQLAEGIREQIATRLAVPTMTLIAGARGWARSWKLRGGAIRAVLLALAAELSLVDRMLGAGAASGLWAHPRRWEAGKTRWVEQRWPDSRAWERRRAPGWGSRDGPPTKMTDPPGP